MYIIIRTVAVIMTVRSIYGANLSCYVLRMFFLIIVSSFTVRCPADLYDWVRTWTCSRTQVHYSEAQMLRFPGHQI